MTTHNILIIMMHKRFLFCTGLLLLVFTVGCSGYCRLKGKVVFSDDKTPLTQGEVCFVTDKNIARGPIDENGNYVVSSIKKNDGLLRGTYRVYLTETEINERIPGTPAFNMFPQIDTKYNSPDTSGLVLDVKRSMTYDIEVDRYEPPKR